MKLTKLMLDALQAAHRQPLRRVHDGREGKPPWPAAPGTIRALERHLLLVRSERLSRQGWRIEEWMTTESAVALLFPPPILLVEQPMFLARQGSERFKKLPNGRWAVDNDDHGASDRGYTTTGARSIDHLECVDAPASFVEAGRLKHREAMPVQDRARRLRRAA